MGNVRLRERCVGIDGDTSHLHITSLSITHTFQPLDVGFFGPWRARVEKLLCEKLPHQRVDTKEIIRIAMQAWREMFPLDDKGEVIANRGLIKAWVSTGIVPFDRHALQPSVFMPAEAAGKALAAARVKAGIPNPSPAAAQALIDEVTPLAPAIPVSVESARQVAKRRRPKSSTILTGREAMQIAAAAILAKEEADTNKLRKQQERVAKRLAGVQAKALRAQATAARKAARALRGPTKKPTRKATAAAKTSEDTGIDCVVEPLAGVKRQAEAAGLGEVGGGMEAVPPRLPRTLRLVVNPPK